MSIKLPSWTLRHVIAPSLLALLASPLMAETAAENYRNSPQVAELVNEMTRDYGFASDQLLALFAQVEPKQSILDAISRPAEKTKAWKDYRPIFITDARIGKGVTFWNQHADTLARAQQDYGVPPEIIVSIIGVETFYGGNTGSYRVLDALSTLCFDYPPRAAFFCQQLKEFLLLARQEQRDPLSLKGSYAGAMGLPQFMPSSFRAYAVDFDGDGHIDIWNNPVDAIGSVANYFKQHGWTPDGQVMVEATVQGEQAETGLLQGIDDKKTVGQLRALGWATNAPLRDDQQVIAFRLEADDGMHYWLGLPNFQTITRYNRSTMYSTAVYQLAQALADARGKP